MLYVLRNVPFGKKLHFLINFTGFYKKKTIFRIKLRKCLWTRDFSARNVALHNIKLAPLHKHAACLVSITVRAKLHEITEKHRVIQRWHIASFSCLLPLTLTPWVRQIRLRLPRRKLPNEIAIWREPFYLNYRITIELIPMAARPKRTIENN